MSDVWGSMLYQLCPTYDDLKFSMEKGPTINPNVGALLHQKKIPNMEMTP